MSEKHKWSKEDYVVVFYLYRFGMESLGDPFLLANFLNIRLSSINMKFGNLISAKYGEAEGGLKANTPDLEIVEEFGTMPE